MSAGWGWGSGIFAGLALLAAYAAGPRARKPHLDGPLPWVPREPAQAEAWLRSKEAGFALKPDNQAWVLWGGEPQVRQPWCILYLHGYSACWREGAPLNVNTARRYGANLLLARLSGHGLRVDEPLLDLQAQALWEDAKEALALAGSLGDRVLIMATSSGAPLALQLARRFPERVQALAFYSPNFRIRAAGSSLLTWPWGLQLGRLIKGSNYNQWEASEEQGRYWYARQRLEGAVQLQALLDASLGPEDLAQVRQPLYCAAYYRDESKQDPTVDVKAMRSTLRQLGTPAEKLRYQEFPDAGTHVIACDLFNPNWEKVQAGTWDYMEKVLGWSAKTEK